MDATEDRSKALNEHMSSGFAPRADIVAACRHVRFVPFVVKVQNCPVIIFPPLDDSTDDRRSM
jgi:hypothetical protein